MEKWRQKLKELGLKVTPQRMLVLQTLETCGEETHPSAEQLWEAINAEHPDISKATIYRILKSLSDSGLINELYLRDGKARYELNIDHHHHFVCLTCHKIQKIPGCHLHNASVLNAQQARVVTHNLEFFGYCADCTEDEKE